MKEILDEDSKNALIAYRVQRAYETLKGAKVMIPESFYNVQTHTHNGVKTMLGLHFITTGILPLKIGKTFTTLFEKRHSGDYDDFAYCDEEMVNELYPDTEAYVDAIKVLIEID